MKTTEKDIGVTQKTAWFMLHRLRFSSKTKAFNAPLKNIVEVDESYIGGDESNKHSNKRTKGTQGRSVKTKTPVLVALERNGNVKAIATDKVNHQTVGSFITNNVVLGSHLMSDQFKVYSTLKWLYNHSSVNHDRGQYVDGDVHTNNAENFFSIFKRGVLGIYHSVSPEHLNKYLNEFTFRYNTRGYSEEERFNLMLSNCNKKRLTYKELTTHV